MNLFPFCRQEDLSKEVVIRARETGAVHNFVIQKKVTKVLKCLNQCFARLRSYKSVTSKTAVDPASRFREFETLFPTSKSCKTLI